MPINDIHLQLHRKTRAEAKLVDECWENLRNLLRQQLGTRLKLGKAGKLNVELGSSETDHLRFTEVDGIGTLLRSDFDLDGYLNLSPAQQDQKALDYAVDSLKWLALRNDADPRPVDMAAAAILASGFRFEKPLPKASAWNAARTLQARTFLCFRRGGGGVAVETRFFEAGGRGLGQETVIADKHSGRHWLDPHWKAHWEGGHFTLENTDFIGQRHLPKPFRSLDYTQLLS